MSLYWRPGQGTCLSHTHSSAPKNVLSEGLMSSWETSALPIHLTWCLRDGRRGQPSPAKPRVVVAIGVAGRLHRRPQPIWKPQ